MTEVELKYFSIEIKCRKCGSKNCKLYAVPEHDWFECSDCRSEEEF